MMAAIFISPFFGDAAKKEYVSITVSAGANGKITPAGKDGTVQVIAGTKNKKLSIIPDNNYHVSQVTANGTIIFDGITNSDPSHLAQTGTSKKYSYTFNTISSGQTYSIAAAFEADPSYTVSVSVFGNGRVTSMPGGIKCDDSSNSVCSKSGVRQGAQIMLVAMPDRSGKIKEIFGGWGGACSGTKTNCTIKNITSDVSATAIFSITDYTDGTDGGGGVVVTPPPGIVLPPPPPPLPPPQPPQPPLPPPSSVSVPSIYWTALGSINKLALSGGTVTTVDTPPGPYGIAVDSKNIYWMSIANNSVNKIAKDGGTATWLASVEQVPPYTGNMWMTIDSSSVYWLEGANGQGAVKKVSKNGGTVTTIASNLPSPVNIAVDSDSVYWTDRTGYVSKVGINGGTVTTLYSGVADKEAPNGIAVDGTSVYWTEATFGTSNTVDGSNYGIVIGAGNIRKVAKSGGDSMIIAQGSTSPEDMTLDSQNVYWIDHTNPPSNSKGSIMKVEKNGGEVTALASDQSSPTGLAVGPFFVCWLQHTAAGDTSGSVLAVSINGGSVTTIASGQNNPGQIVIDH